jgi:PAS domain S-box-containing protein
MNIRTSCGTVADAPQYEHVTRSTSAAAQGAPQASQDTKSASRVIASMICQASSGPHQRDVGAGCTAAETRSKRSSHLIARMRLLTPMDRDGHGALDALRRSEELNRRILDAVPGGVVHVAMDGAILRANAEALRILGLRLDELTQRYVADFATETIREDGAPFPASEYPVSRALATGVQQGPDTIGVRRPDGATSWAVFRAVPVCDPDSGQTTGAVVTFLDITARKQSEEALRTSQEQWRALAENIPDVAVLLDQGGTIRFINRTPPDVAQGDVIGTKATDWVAPELRSAFLERVAHVFATGECVSFETKSEGRSGRVGQYEDRVGPVMAGGVVTGAVLVARDVSERAALLEQLRRSERMASVGLLAAGVAHEINNPLTYVLANLSHVLERWSGDPQHRQVLQEALEGALRVRDIVRDLRTLSRDDGRVDTGVVDVQPVLEAAIQMAGHGIRHPVEIVRAYEQVPSVVASEGRLGQVVLNLIVNAAQAIPVQAADGRIVVGTRADGEHVVIEVRDNGTGIAAEHLPRVFDPFFTTKSVGQGTGLGLSICYNLVDAMKGTIDVASEPGRGTTVIVRLPAATGIPLREWAEVAE